MPPDTPVTPPIAQPAREPEQELFRSPRAADGDKRNWIPLGVAIGVALIALLLVVLLGHRAAQPVPLATAGPAAPDPYAQHLALSDILMSEATTFTGGKVTYLDGRIQNLGDKTVTAVAVQVTFNNDLGELPQRVTVPLNLIRAHQPYIDTEHVAANPIGPGANREFRLIFDSVTPIWNQQMPQGQIVHTELR